MTGAFVSHHGWDAWREYFESKGYTTHAPAWPHKEGQPDVLRSKHPIQDTDLANLRYIEVVDHYANFIKKLPEQPIVVGHSLGGLTVQLLLQRNLVAAAVAIHSVPPQGVFSFELSFYKSLWSPLGLFSSTKKTYLMSFKDWQYSFTNGMSYDDQKRAYDANTIPESRLALRDPLSSVGKVDFKKSHNPLLFISGSTDHIMPAPLNYRNFKRYKDKGSITRYKEFEGHNHFVLGLPSWREEADYILDFIESN
ncbi:alpha/beta hydrolase [Flavobacterium sp.]|uniref:alpha/beta hydrolase n=1 Tax=Flavobacterium sp. TaxID=239 RepID=UPI002B4B38D0|nr:alpha/beta hydrolase [Flavobacterium sp.]HLP64702.1 alpha/beta hydrolase [Flavobacterium sp.]